MLEEGLGVALLPIVAVARELELGQLASVPIVDAGPVHRRMVVIRRNDVGPPGGIASAFLDLLLEMVGTHAVVGSANGSANGNGASHGEVRTASAVLSVGPHRPGLTGE
jgi:hypothetical protein